MGGVENIYMNRNDNVSAINGVTMLGWAQINPLTRGLIVKVEFHRFMFGMNVVCCGFEK